MVKSFSVAKLLGIKDNRKGIDWSIILVIIAATVASSILMDDGCKAEMEDPSKPIGQRCLTRLIPALIITIFLMVLQFQRLVGRCA